MDDQSDSDDDTFTSRDFSGGSDIDLSDDDRSFVSDDSVNFSFASTDGEEDEMFEDPPAVEIGAEEPTNVDNAPIEEEQLNIVDAPPYLLSAVLYLPVYSALKFIRQTRQ